MEIDGGKAALLGAMSKQCTGHGYDADDALVLIGYTGAPSTSLKAYTKAPEALPKFEDMTFSEEEIDAFLPKELKRDRP